MTDPLHATLPPALLKTILIIDDEPSLLGTLAIGLEAAGYRVLVASDAASGWKQAHAHLPDLILSDIDMPGKDGKRLLQELRADPILADRQFVLMTGKPATGNQRTAMDLGADDFLLKPFSQLDLLRCVSARLKREHLSRRIDDRVLERLHQSLHMALPHEFFTPLASILGLAELLRDDCHQMTPDEMKKDLGDICIAGRMLHRTLCKYLLLVELETTRAGRDVPVLNAEAVIDALGLGLMNAGERQRRARDIESELAGAPVRANDQDLSALMEELVDNGLRFSRLGSPVRVRSVREGSSLHLTVTDFGRGMTAPQLERLRSSWRPSQGILQQESPGLGLMLVHRLVHHLQGDFRIESQPGIGTIAHVTLPIP